MSGRFAGKVALVTGSTQGLGEAVVRRLADEGAAGVVVTGRDADRGQAVVASLAVDALFVPGDLADAASPPALIAAADERFGRIDVLVNAAADTARGSIVDTTPELFDRLMAVNVRAPMQLMQGAIAVMRREEIEGTIVNVASVAAGGSMPYLAPYAASKAALIALSKNVAFAVMWDRIRVNVVSPGWIDTPGESAIQRRYHGGGDDWLEKAEAGQPFGRLIKVGELAGLIAYLASEESGLMTGSVVPFDQSVVGAGHQPIPRREETP